MPGFGCHRKGHRPMDGWDAPPQQNQLGHWFVPRVCRDCHATYIEFIGAQEVSKLVDLEGKRVLA